MKTINIAIIMAIVLMIGVMGNTGLLTLSAVSLIAFGIKKLHSASNFKEASLGVGFMTLALFVGVSMVFPEFAPGLVGPGVIMAVTPVLGEQSVSSVRDQSREDVFVPDVDDEIHMIGKDDFPFTTMKYNMAKKRKQKKAKNWEITWYEDTYYDREDSVASAVTAAGGLGPHTIVATNPESFTKGNIISIPTIDNVTSNTEYDDLKLRVDSINYTSGAMVVYVMNGTSLPAIPDATKMYRLTFGGSELQAQVKAKHKIPEKKTNYVQRFMGQVEISMLKKMTDTYTDDDQKRELRKQIYDFRITEEMADLFGVKDIAVDSEDGSNVLYQGGVESYAGQYLEYTQGTLTNADFIGWTKDMFAQTNGSRKRLLLADDELLYDILNTSFVQKQLDAGSTKVVYGVECQTIRTTFGELYIKHHKGFAEAGRHYYGMVVDMANVCDKVMQPMTKTKLELKKSGQKNVDADLIEKYKSLQVANANTHGIIKGV